jgi:CRISPR-associated protein Csm4
MAMNLIRFRIVPTGGWLTPWQADTLTGMLASALGRAHGTERLERDLLEPWRWDQPPFVLSDAFPGDLLPCPACLALWPWPESQRKYVKRTEWLSADQFHELQRGRRPDTTGHPPAPLQSSLRMRNSLDRQSDRTGTAGSLYEVPLAVLSDQDSYLSVYAKVAAGKEKFLVDLLGLLSDSGFGADTSVGQGQFRVEVGFEGASWLEQVEGANAWISLSTFQPSRKDPSEGYWRSFVKYGKLGPDFGVEGVFKRPQWMLRAGSCFREAGSLRDWYGSAIGSDKLLPEATRRELAGAGIHPVHPAFALPVPMKWAPEYQV